MTDAPKLLLDEMLSGDIAFQLRSRGHDVIAVAEDRALVGSPDEELLVYATSTGRALVTMNIRDFAAIHGSWSSRGRSHLGLIYIVNRVFPTDRAFVGAIVNALDAAVASGRVSSHGDEVYLRRQT